jgi:hypothetical protein
MEAIRLQGKPTLLFKVWKELGMVASVTPELRRLRQESSKSRVG